MLRKLYDKNFVYVYIQNGKYLNLQQNTVTRLTRLVDALLLHVVSPAFSANYGFGSDQCEQTTHALQNSETGNQTTIVEQLSDFLFHQERLHFRSPSQSPGSMSILVVNHKI